MVFLSYFSSGNEKTGLAEVKCTTGDLRIKRVLYSRKGEDLFLRQQKSLVFFIYSCSREEEIGIAAA
jgi:hypothetical protein